MNILFGSAVTDEIRDKYILLPLDTFYFTAADRQETAYCLIDNISITELMSVDEQIAQHNELIEHYQQGDFDSCRQRIDQLMGQWGGEIDSFYQELIDRIKNRNVDKDNWSPVIVRD